MRASQPASDEASAIAASAGRARVARGGLPPRRAHGNALSRVPSSVTSTSSSPSAAITSHG